MGTAQARAVLSRHTPLSDTTDGPVLGQIEVAGTNSTTLRVWMQDTQCAVRLNSARAVERYRPTLAQDEDGDAMSTTLRVGMQNTQRTAHLKGARAVDHQWPTLTQIEVEDAKNTATRAWIQELQRAVRLNGARAAQLNNSPALTQIETGDADQANPHDVPQKQITWGETLGEIVSDDEVYATIVRLIVWPIIAQRDEVGNQPRGTALEDLIYNQMVTAIAPLGKYSCVPLREATENQQNSATFPGEKGWVQCQLQGAEATSETNKENLIATAAKHPDRLQKGPALRNIWKHVHSCPCEPHG